MDRGYLVYFCSFNYSLLLEARHKIFSLWYYINSPFLILEYLGFQIFGLIRIVIYWLNILNPSVMVCQFERCPHLGRAFVFWLEQPCKWWTHIGFLQRGDSCVASGSLRDSPFANQQIVRWVKQVERLYFSTKKKKSHLFLLSQCEPMEKWTWSKHCYSRKCFPCDPLVMCAFFPAPHVFMPMGLYDHHNF